MIKRNHHNVILYLKEGKLLGRTSGSTKIPERESSQNFIKKRISFHLRKRVLKISILHKQFHRYLLTKEENKKPSLFYSKHKKIKLLLM